MNDHERRRDKPPHPLSLRHGLSDRQRRALFDLESFGWELKFVRRRPFQPVEMFFHDPQRDVYARIEEDGSLTECDAAAEIRRSPPAGAAAPSVGGHSTRMEPFLQDSVDSREGNTPMSDYERRGTMLPTANQLRSLLSEPQLRILEELEQAGWELGFVRSDRLPSPLMFVYDQASDRYTVVDTRGRFEDPIAHAIRH